jgi:ankyrin repeat protein
MNIILPKRTKEQLDPVYYLYHCVEDNDIAGVIRALVMGVKADTYAAYMDGMTPLFVASKNANLPIMKLLLLAGANPNKEHNKNGMTPLFLAAATGNLESVELLLEAGAEPNKQDKITGQYPIHSAMKNNHIDIVKRLLDAGADPNSLDKSNNPLLYYQLRYNQNIPVIKLLLSYGANINLLFTNLTQIETKMLKEMVQEKYPDLYELFNETQ